MLVIGVVCWITEESQIPELRRCLDSLKEFRVILVDGKWYDMEGEQHTSIPKAYDMFAQYPNVEVIVSINKHEWENRNLYLERCKEDDFLIWIDTDEWLEVNISPLKHIDDLFDYKNTGEQMVSVLFQGKAHGAGIYETKRGVLYPSKTRHRDRHNELWCDGKEITQGRLNNIFGLIIHHDKSFRSEGRENAMRIRNRLKPFR